MSTNSANGIFYRKTESINLRILVELLPYIEDYLKCRFDRIMLGEMRGPRKVEDVSSYIVNNACPLTTSVMIGNRESLSASSDLGVVIHYEPSFYESQNQYSRFTVSCSRSHLRHHNPSFVSGVGDRCLADWGEFYPDYQSKILRAIQDRWHWVPDDISISPTLAELKYRRVLTVFVFGVKTSWEFYASDESFRLLEEESRMVGVDIADQCKTKTDRGWYVTPRNEPLDLSNEDHATAIVKLNQLLVRLRREA